MDFILDLIIKQDILEPVSLRYLLLVVLSVFII